MCPLQACAQRRVSVCHLQSLRVTPYLGSLSLQLPLLFQLAVSTLAITKLHIRTKVPALPPHLPSLSNIPEKLPKPLACSQGKSKMSLTLPKTALESVLQRFVHQSPSQLCALRSLQPQNHCFVFRGLEEKNLTSSFSPPEKFTSAPDSWDGFHLAHWHK